LRKFRKFIRFSRLNLLNHLNPINLRRRRINQPFNFHMQRLPHIFFAPSPLGGRGVFTSEPIPKDSLIEICPVIVLPEEELPIIHKTFLHDYYFLWGENEEQCAIALGFGSLYNHAYDSNAEYIIDLDELTIDIYSVRDIEAGEEITVNYNGEPGDMKPVWFDRDDYER